MVASGGRLYKGHGRGGPGPYRWRWLDGGRGITVAMWTRRRAAPAYAPISDLTKDNATRLMTYSFSDNMNKAVARQVSVGGSMVVRGMC